MNETTETEAPGIGHNLPPEEFSPERLRLERLRELDPEKLLLIDLGDVAALLDIQYAALTDRGAALIDAAEAWYQRHRDPDTKQVVIRDDADNNGASDLYSQMRDHAGDRGEVEEARLKVKADPFRLVQIIDGWFKARRERHIKAMEIIDAAQNAYLRAKAAAELAQRQEAARLARIEAERAQREAAADAARITQEAEARARDAIARARQDNAPAAALGEALDAEADAEVITSEAQTEAAERARPAQEAAYLAERRLDAPVADLTRSRSAMGVTTSQAATWTWRLTSIRELATAVAKGDAPEDFLTTNDRVITATVKPKNGRRACDGLEIYQDFAVRRRGA